MQAGGSYNSGRVLITLVCLGIQAELMLRPVGVYTESSLGSILQALEFGEPDALKNIAAGNNSGVERLEKENLSELADLHPGSELTTPIVTRFAYAVAMVRLSESAQSTKDIEEAKPDPTVLKCIGGKLRLVNTEQMKSCSTEFFCSIVKAVQAGMQGGSVWDTLVRTITSTDFMLQLIPRITVDSKNDYKSEICTMDTWNESPEFRINNAHILSMSTQTREAMSWLSSPDVVLVNFPDALDAYSKDQGSDGIVGVATVDPDLYTTLRSSGISKALLDSERLSWVVQVAAPSWLSGIIDPAMKEEADKSGTPPVNSGTKPLVNNKTLISNVPPSGGQEKENSDQASIGDQVPRPSSDSVLYKTLDDFAKAVLMSMYKSGDSATVDINPAIRNNWVKYGSKSQLEDLLGRTIELTLTLGAKALVKLGTIRGVLSSLSYSCSSNVHSAASYTLTLTRVRVMSGKMDDFVMSSSIYTK